MNTSDTRPTSTDIDSSENRREAKRGRREPPATPIRPAAPEATVPQKETVR
ncbi:hypothetical protein [Streptomyces cavernae]|uniref:hypothetical protein n=1 Tax=Streptomyces cavernae TaxID=2259034 RepID=UPI0012D87D47|nr:hypothetical protein [Streptomyces cavernae]